MSFSFNIAQNTNNNTVHFSGRIITETDFEALAKALSSSENELQNNWIFDLSELTHINSSGINFIIRSLTKNRIKNGEVIVCGVTGNVKSLFEIAKLDGIFTIYKSYEEALNHFNTNK